MKSKLLLSLALTGAIAFTFCSDPKPIAGAQTKSPVPGYDPYFVQSADTVSIYGPDCITRDLIQDKNGIFWFATWHGIISYDGKLFTNHTLKEGLAQFHFLDILEDSKGNIWFASAGGGVYCYDGKTFTRFTSNEGLGDNYVVCIAEDNDGTIWYGTKAGASSFNGKTFTNFTMPNDLQGGHVNSIIQDKTRKMWFGTSRGLFTCDSPEHTKSLGGFKLQGGNPFNVASLFEDRTGKIWIGKMNGLTIYDPVADDTIHRSDLNDTLSALLTYYIIEDKAGTIWLSHSEPTIGTAFVSQILYRYDGKHFENVVQKSDANDFQIFGKIEDNAGNIWFGTMKGPCRYDGKSVTHFYE